MLTFFASPLTSDHVGKQVSLPVSTTAVSGVPIVPVGSAPAATKQERKRKKADKAVGKRSKSDKNTSPHSRRSTNSTSSSAAKLLNKAKRILRALMKHELAWPFCTPVDPVRLQIPDYFLVIKTPMDFGTIRVRCVCVCSPQSLSAICAPQLTSLPQKKLESGQYPSLTEFEADMELVFTNCFTYNLPGSDIFIMAETLRKVFREQLADLVYSHQHMTAAESTPTEPAAPPKPRTNKPKSMRPPS